VGVSCVPRLAFPLDHWRFDKTQTSFKVTPLPMVVQLPGTFEQPPKRISRLLAAVIEEVWPNLAGGSPPVGVSLIHDVGSWLGVMNCPKALGVIAHRHGLHDGVRVRCRVNHRDSITPLFAT